MADNNNLIEDLIKERKGERFWRWVRRGGIVSAVLIATIMSLGSKFGWFDRGPSGDVAIVSIRGEIGDGKRAGAVKVVEQLREAFDGDQYSAVILDIDSGGGQPQEAERIIAEMSRLDKENDKRVIAVISGVGASAAYMIAAHADEVVAGKYSMVGSIGAVLQTWNVSNISDRVGVSKVTITSGKYKDLLNPFRAFTEEDREKASELVNRMAKVFIDDMKASRGARLKRDDIFTGEVWSGEDAMDIGLVDRIGTIESELAKLGGDPADLASRESDSMTDGVTASLMDGVESVLAKSAGLRF